MTDAEADKVPLCTDCVRHDGLCTHHASHIAALAQPGWYRLVGTDHLSTKAKKEVAPSHAAQLIINKRQRLHAKRATELRQLVEMISTPMAA